VRLPALAFRFVLASRREERRRGARKCTYRVSGKREQARERERERERERGGGGGEETQKREKDDEETGGRANPRDVSSIFTCLVSGLIVSQFLRCGDLVAA